MKKINIALVGLGQIGNYLLNELNKKKRDIEIKTGKKINIVAISARNINKKRKFRINKKIFYKNPLNIFNSKKIDILFECIGLSEFAPLCDRFLCGVCKRMCGVTFIRRW